MPPKIIIAIDGYAACGKSTLARQLAEKLAYTYLDTGAMYRALTLYCLRNELPATDARVAEHLPHIRLHFEANTQNGKRDLFLNEENVEKEIRTMSVSDRVSAFAALPSIRTFCVEAQREIGKAKGIVADGRDMGTVVFPKAEIKFFITAAVAERAERRWRELQKNGENIPLEIVRRNVEKRDTMDTTRTHAPLVQAPDAIVIDNTHLNLEEQFKLAYTYLDRLLKGNKASNKSVSPIDEKRE